MEGLITIIFGVILYFLLPDCKSSCQSGSMSETNTRSSPTNSTMAHRKRESLHPSPAPKERSPRSRKQLQFPRNHHSIERLQDVALHTLLGNLYRRNFRPNLLSTNRGSKLRLHLDLEISTPEYPHGISDSWHNCRLRSLGRHSALTTPLIPALLPDNHHGLLFSPLYLPQHRWRLRRHHNSICLRLLLVPHDVALARANHLSRHGFCLQHRLRQLLRTDWWCPWPTDIQEPVCAALYC